ncbi:MAG TPA: acyltransferase [Bryobacteraceae bacterium]|nr:acyltransferase [Bryobacteraceae bacterium]
MIETETLQQTIVASVVNHRPTPSGAEHVFVNNIRHWSMFAIVFIHSYVFAAGSALELPFGTEMFVQAAKFGTIGFFFISGFLLGERVEARGRLEYLKRRLRRLCMPWMFWIAAYCCLLVVGHAVLQEALPTFDEIASLVFQTLFNTAYWFVPNMLLASAMMLAFARYLEDWRFGGALLGAALFYAANIYGHWIPSQHSTAVFGFVGYLWLGAWSSRNWEKVRRFLSQFPPWLLLCFAILAWALCLAEAHHLRSLGSVDPLNALRISNQAFSIVVVMLFLKLSKPAWPKFINVRKHTFGLYLTHSLVLVLIMRVLKQYTGSGPASSALGRFALGTLAFALTYAGSVILTKWLAAHPKLSWSVGAKANDR